METKIEQLEFDDNMGKQIKRSSLAHEKMTAEDRDDHTSPRFSRTKDYIIGQMGEHG